MTTYSEKLKSPKWQKKRLEIFRRDKWTCKLCGDTETTLHVHHKEYFDKTDPWDYDNKLLVTLCEHCHELISNDSDLKLAVFSDIKIYKSNNWNGGARIMFAKYNDFIIMAIYKKDGSHIIGFNFSATDFRKISNI